MEILMADKEYKGQLITGTVEAVGSLTGTSIGTWQEDYLLREVEFVHIKRGKSVTFLWANSFLLTTFGFGINLLAKWFSSSDNTISPISKGEWIAFGCGAVFALILYIIGYFIPNERKKVMNDIESHFKNGPKMRQAVESNK